MTLEVAFVLLCIAQIVHFSNRWYALSLVLLEDFRNSQLRNAVDWRLGRPRRSRKKSLLDEIFTLKR